MHEHVKTGCKHIPPSEQPLQFQSGYFLNKLRISDMIRVKWSRLFCGHNYIQIAKRQSAVGYHLVFARAETTKAGRQTYWAPELPRGGYLFSIVLQSAIDIARKWFPPSLLCKYKLYSRLIIFPTHLSFLTYNQKLKPIYDMQFQTSNHLFQTKLFQNYHR